jgi:hypothetical protein
MSKWQKHTNKYASTGNITAPDNPMNAHQKKKKRNYPRMSSCHDHPYDYPESSIKIDDISNELPQTTGVTLDMVKRLIETNSILVKFGDSIKEADMAPERISYLQKKLQENLDSSDIQVLHARIAEAREIERAEQQRRHAEELLKRQLIESTYTPTQRLSSIDCDKLNEQPVEQYNSISSFLIALTKE